MNRAFRSLAQSPGFSVVTPVILRFPGRPPSKD